MLLVVLDGSGAIVEAGQDVAEVVELTRIERVEGGGPFIGALGHERTDGQSGEIIRSEPLLSLTRDLHHRERRVERDAPSNDLDHGRLAHARCTLDEEHTRLSSAQRFERLGHGLKLPAPTGNRGIVESMKGDLGCGLLGVRLARPRNAVATPLLRHVQGDVRLTYEVAAVRGVGWRRSDPNAERNIDRAFPPGEIERALPGELLEPAGLRHRLLQFRRREEHHELVATESNRIGVLTRNFLQESGHENEDLVARVVTVGVVDALEEIDVQERE